MLERMEPPVDGRPCPAGLLLPRHTRVDLPTGHLGEGNGDGSTEQAPIAGIARDGVPGELSALQVRLNPGHGGLAHIVPRLALRSPVALGDLRHSLVVWGPCGSVIEWGRAAWEVEGTGPHELVDDL